MENSISDQSYVYGLILKIYSVLEGILSLNISFVMLFLLLEFEPGSYTLWGFIAFLILLAISNILLL